MEVDKRYPVGTHWKRIACLILPSLKMHRLGWTDTEDDAQDFWVAYPLSKLRVEAGTTLLNKGKMEPCRVSDHLETRSDAVLRGGGDATTRCVGIVFGDCAMLPDIQTGDGLLKREIGVEIGIVSVVPVPTPEAGVDRKLQKIGESLLSRGPCRRTASQRAEMLSTQEIDVRSRGALRSQVIPKEGLVTELVIRIVGDVLKHITIENGESRGVERGPSAKSRRNLATRT